MKYFIVVLVLAVLVVGVAEAKVIVTDTKPQGTLQVKDLPAQPKLEVVNGTSRVYEDGSVDWQPAINVQNTYNPQR